MRYILIAAALLLLAGCLSVAPTPTPAVDVPALQTEAAALNAVTTARAQLAQPLFPTVPPVEATRGSLEMAYTLALIGQRYDDPPPTQTAAAATISAIEATLTALPTSVP